MRAPQTGPQTGPAQTLRLARCGAADPGAAYGLRRGDLLLGVDGQPWRGTAAALATHLARARRPVALSFGRGAAVLTILSPRADLGPWETTPPPSEPAELPAPLGLTNWEILRHPDGTHDLFRRAPSLLALIAPALWLAQMRMWTWLATLACGMALALPGGPPLVIAVWLAAGLHLWRAGPGHLRAARLAQGYHPVGVIAARGEAGACQHWSALNPTARFRFIPANRTTISATEDPDAATLPAE